MFWWCPAPGALCTYLYHSPIGCNCCFCFPVSLILLSCSDSTHNILRAQHLLIEMMTKLTWSAFLEGLGKLWKSGLQVGGDYLAYLISWFSTFCKFTASLSSFISSFTLPLSWCLRSEIVQWWDQPQALPSEMFSSAFRGGCIKVGPAIKDCD